MRTFAAILLAMNLYAQQAPSRAGTETGYAAIEQRCVTCHALPNSKGAPGAPGLAALRDLTPERIYQVLSSNAAHQALPLNDDQRKRAAESTAGRLLDTLESGDAKLMSNRCSANPPLRDPSSTAGWNGWGNDGWNDRFQTAKAAGLNADQVPRLKLKWAFGFPNGVSSWGQPSIVSGRVFVGEDTGWIYSLDAATGCVYWSHRINGWMRNAISVAPIRGNASGHAAAKYALFFGDLKMNVYALDAQTGEQLWMVHADDHITSRATAAPTYYNGKLFVPVSSWEGFNAKQAEYPCCTSRGSVTALDANTGKQIWKFYTTPEPPKPTRKNAAGTQLFGPSGVSVWDSPTVDPKLNAIYFGTGEAAVGPVPKTSDAVVALDMNSGKLLWSYQAQADDEYLVGCGTANRPMNCPQKDGPDYDIGNSPILKTLSNGRRVLIAGMKNGQVFALDPDKKGAKLWEVTVSPNPASGILWGGAADGNAAYFGLSLGGVVAVQLATGEKMWFNELEPRAGSGRAANSAAVTAIPGAVFSGSRNGMLYALSAGDGKKLWEFDLAHEFDTVNNVKARGGTVASSGPVIANGMMFIASGYSFGGGDKNGNVLLAFGLD